MSGNQEALVIDLNDLFPAKTSVQMAQEKMAVWDTAPYQNKPVRIKGCSPTWAHLMVAGKLFGTVSSIDFILDDSKGGISIPVYRCQK